MPDTLHEYNIRSAIETARKILNKLANNNTAYGAARDEYMANPDSADDWEIRTPVNEPLKSGQEHNLVTLASEIVHNQIGKTKVSIVSHASKKIGAYCKRYSDHSEIIVTEHNYCATRYFLCKELLHLFLYDDSNATCTSSDLTALITSLLDPLPSEITNPAYQVEQAAYVGAIELLIPTTYVPMLLSAREDMIARKVTPGKENLHIAILLGVPEKLVEFRFSTTGIQLFNSYSIDEANQL